MPIIEKLIWLWRVRVLNFISLWISWALLCMRGQKLKVLENTSRNVPFPPLSQHTNPQSIQERINFRKLLQLSFPVKNYISANRLSHRLQENDECVTIWKIMMALYLQGTKKDRTSLHFWPLLVSPIGAFWRKKKSNRKNNTVQNSAAGILSEHQIRGLVKKILGI